MDRRINVVPYNQDLQSMSKGFRSGNDYLDRFLRGSEALDDGFGKTYVFLASDNKTIIGYYNIGVGYIELLQGTSRIKMGGSVHINCFALHKEYQGILQAKSEDNTVIKMSDLLLDDCLRRILELRENHIGFSFVTLCSTREGHNLYKRNEFCELEEDMSFTVDKTDKDCILMYLPLDIE